jgi:hypothetical protein
MAYDPSAPVKKTADQIGHQIVDATQRDQFFQQLQQQGWIMVGNPIQFPGNSDPATLRHWAKEYATTVMGDFVVEVNDPSFSTEPSNTLVFFIWRQASAYQQSAVQQQAQQQPAYSQPAAAGAAVAPAGPAQAPAYANPLQVLEQQLFRLATLLADPTPRFNFQDTGELLYPFVTIRLNAYEHLGERKMDLYLVKDGIYDYKIMGNETHGASGGRLVPYKDELFSFKTLGKASYMILDEYRQLEPGQQNMIIAAVQAFLTQY